MKRAAKIRKIRPRKTLQVVNKLKEWVAKAEDGQIDAVIVAATGTDGTVLYSYAGHVSPKIIGASTLATHWVMHILDDDL